MEKIIKEMLISIGENPDREGLIDTPKRVSKAWSELMTPPEFNPTIFSANGYDQMILERGITFYTFCEHHMIPFFGTVDIGYIPDKYIIGISKLPRTVEYYTKMLNTQEYFTNNIAQFLWDKLKPKGIGVVVRGRHLCQEMRGVKKRGEMITSSLKGAMLKNATARKEFLDLCKKQ
tara:strand:+ start:792 stop:1319 length:528 start_codon:yes stop_codon:yes gene_type:complete